MPNNVRGNRFVHSLQRVCGAVYAVFDTDDAMAEWVAMLQEPHAADQRAFTLRLETLLTQLESGWVSRLLVNEDKSEESGVLAEALIATMRAYDGTGITRSEFSYRLTNAILNKGVRLLNRSAVRVKPGGVLDPFVTDGADPDNLAESERQHFDDLLVAMLRRRSTVNEVATPDVVLAVKRAWLESIKEVEVRLGGAHAKPLSAAVKHDLAKRLDLPVATVEAAMKRLRRACKKVMVESNKDISDWLVE